MSHESADNLSVTVSNEQFQIICCTSVFQVVLDTEQKAFVIVTQIRHSKLPAMNLLFLHIHDQQIGCCLCKLVALFIIFYFTLFCSKKQEILQRYNFEGIICCRMSVCPAVTEV